MLFSFDVWEMKKQIGEYRVSICTRPIGKKLYNEIHFTRWHNYSVGNGKMDSLIIKKIKLKIFFRDQGLPYSIGFPCFWNFSN